MVEYCLFMMESAPCDPSYLQQRIQTHEIFSVGFWFWGVYVCVKTDEGTEPCTQDSADQSRSKDSEDHKEVTARNYRNPGQPDFNKP